MHDNSSEDSLRLIKGWVEQRTQLGPRPNGDSMAAASTARSGPNTEQTIENQLW